MNQKQRRLTEQLNDRVTKREQLLESQRKTLEEFDEETKRIETRLDKCSIAENAALLATNAWCRVTNALIAKYKTMTEEDPQKAYKQLIRIEGALLAGEFLTEEDLEKAL